MKTKPVADETAFGKLLDSHDVASKIPAVGDAVKGTVITATKRAIHVSIDGLTTGVIRGQELYNLLDDQDTLRPGDEVEAIVVGLDNENGEMELSLKEFGHSKAWDKLAQLVAEQTPVPVQVTDANKGGLMVRYGSMMGFLPVSQLSPEHYPRVPGGDKNKILERLKQLVGVVIEVRAITADSAEDKLIFSEKTLWEERQKDMLNRYKVGDVIEGTVTAVADFGAFVSFDNLEGLIHISELAWQRIDHPQDLVKVGQTVKAEIIKLEGSKIYLSMKKLMHDPWQDIAKKYQVGSMIEGKVLKVNPFGLFVELDTDIHGLAHISELAEKPVKDVKDIAKPGDVLTFRIVSVEAKEHRLGLSLRPAKAKAEDKADAKEAKKEEKTESPTEEPAA